jgi:hypothetical protein
VCGVCGLECVRASEGHGVYGHVRGEASFLVYSEAASSGAFDRDT